MYAIRSYYDYQVSLTVQTTDGCTATQSHTVTVNPLPQASFEYSQPTCVGDTIFFLNLSNSPNGAIVKWEWDFNDGTTETILAPNSGNTSHVYANDQSYYVTLTVTDSDSCQNTVTRTVISVASPVAEFNWEDACFGQPTQFYVITSYSIHYTKLYDRCWCWCCPRGGRQSPSTNCLCRGCCWSDRKTAWAGQSRRRITSYNVCYTKLLRIKKRKYL